MSIRPGAATLLATWLALAVTGLASGHEGEAGIEVAPSRVEAGERVVIHGDDLTASTAVRMELMTADGPLLIAEAETDEEGHLEVAATIPADLPVRYYELRVTDIYGDSVSGHMAVIDPEAEPLPVDSPESGGGPPLVTLAAAVVAIFAGSVLLLIGGRWLVRR